MEVLRGKKWLRHSREGGDLTRSQSISAMALNPFDPAETGQTTEYFLIADIMQ